jgi:carbon storage regulator CsrA
MLVLYRKPEEKVVISTAQGTVTVVMIGSSARGARLGIDAPKACHVLREELVREAAADGQLRQLEDRLDAEENQP